MQAMLAAAKKPKEGPVMIIVDLKSGIVDDENEKKKMIATWRHVSPFSPRPPPHPPRSSS